MLISPNFLFRIERDQKPLTADTPRPVSDHELASRLSYFLWSSTPDDELLRLAAGRRLHNPEALEAQVKRMRRKAKISLAQVWSRDFLANELSEKLLPQK